MTSITMTLSSPDVALKDGKGSLTASVTNGSDAPERVVMGAFPAQATVPPSPTYASVKDPLRTLAPGATEQYVVSFDTTGAAPGSYPVKLIAYSADDAPEDYADQARVVTLVVTQAPPPPVPAPGFPWLWVIIGAVVLLAVIGGVLWFVLRPAPAPPAEAPPTETVKCQPGYVYRLVTPDDKICVSPASAAQVLDDNNEITQLRRKPNPPGGPYGVNTCLQGFVWRDAYNGDQICVTVETRTRTHQENTDAALHSAP